MPRHSQSRERLLETASDLIWRQSYYGTSVDMICERCGIKKGSFYHHFPSKQALVIAALDTQWQGFRHFLDEAFSPSRPPIERFRTYLNGTLANQLAHFEQTSFVLGCPLYSLGTEIGTQEPEIRVKIDEHLGTMARYFTTAIRDGMASGEIPSGDPELISRQVLTFCEGSMTLGRITNSLRPIRDMESGVMRLLGSAATAAAA